MEPDIHSIVPTLRADLHFSVQEKEAEGYILEDPLRQKFYRIGRPEYTLFTTLDGRTSLGLAVERANSLLGDAIFNEDNARVTLQWLVQNQLLADSSDDLLAQRLDQDQKIRRQKLLGRFNLITVKLSLFNPDPIFERISPWLGWLTGPYFAIIWVVTLFYGAMVLFEHWSDFFTTASATLAPGNLFFLWFAWFLLKILHESFHGLTTYRYHGRVFEAGILLIVFFPLTYVDGSSTWNFPNRWQRIHAAFAGIYAELFVAAIAVLIWAENPGTIVGNIAHNLVVVAGFSSLFFNINPLMRFDGYFILADLTGIPNLYSRGKNFVSALFNRLFFGEWSYVRRLSSVQENFIALYGVAAWIWRILIITFLLMLAASAIHGFGIFIAILSLVILIGVPLWKLLDKLKSLYRENSPAFKRFWLVSFICCAGTVLLLNLLSWEKEIKAPAVVQYENELVVRAKVDGIVEKVMIRVGDRVDKGQVLLTLSNPELISELKQQKLYLQRLLLQKRNAIIQENVTSYQVLDEQSLVARNNIALLEEDINDLDIVAETSGTILARRLEELEGTYLRKGREILSIVSEKDKKLLASVDQQEIDAFRDMVGQELEIIRRSMDRSRFSGKIFEVSPKADTAIADNAFSAAHGGPIAVRASASTKNSSTSRSSYEFFFPRFTVEIEIPPSEAPDLLVGQLTTIRMHGNSVSLYDILKKRLTDYFTNRLEGRYQ